MSSYLLRLYVAGKSTTSRRAEQNLRRLQKVIDESWQIEIVDVLANPEKAERAGILATPTLSYEHPTRPRRVIGDISDARKVLEFLGIDRTEIGG